MGRTQHLGLNKFGAEGRISDEGYKFSLRDRDLLDSIIQSLLLHDHAPVATGVSLVGPPAGTSPTLTVADSGGTLLAGRDYYYKVAYVDANGNETEAGAAGLASTPDALTPPPSQVLTTATTGGTLTAGTYKYAVAFYQDAGGITTAPNTDVIVIPSGTSTNTVTIPLALLPDAADGWNIYRKGPGDLEYWFLVAVASGPTEYEDDGSINPDCTSRRPAANTTNSTNKITIDLPAGYLPLDSRVTGWRIYRTSAAGSYPANSLVATVVETTTEGGADLVTTFEDIGDSLALGIPLIQTAVPAPIAQLDAATAFGLLSERLPSALAPLGVRAFNILLPGTLAVGDYHQFVPPHDMLAERIDAFYQGANPTGLTPSTDFVTVRVSDDAVQDEIQSLYNDAVTQNEIQQVYNNASAGTFTLGDGVDTTTSIAFDALASVLKTRLEADIASITTVNVSGSGTVNDPWSIEFIAPGDQDITLMLIVDSGMGGGSSTITTTVEGSDGGTFTLSDVTDTTSAIAFDAAASTIKTRLEADITSITTVSVTGAGTLAAPWLITFENPGSQDLPNLVVDDGSLNGISTIGEDTKGFGVTVVDLIIDQNQAAHFFQTPTTEGASQEAEDAPALGGASVSDSLALNDVAMELDAQNENNVWQVGLLAAGNYAFKFWVADTDLTSTFVLRVNEVTVETQSLYNNSSTGDFTITFQGQTTAAIVWNAANSAVKAALELLPNINTVSVTGIGTVGDPWLIDFDDPAGNVDEITTNDAGMDGSSVIATTVAGTDTVLDSLSLTPARPVYTPEYELFVTLDGTEIVQLEVEKTDTGVDKVRVDKYEYAALLPVLHGGSNVTIEVLVTGTPTTNGDDLQWTLWY